MLCAGALQCDRRPAVLRTVIKAISRCHQRAERQGDKEWVQKYIGPCGYIIPQTNPYRRGSAQSGCWPCAAELSVRPPRPVGRIVFHRMFSANRACQSARCLPTSPSLKIFCCPQTRAPGAPFTAPTVRARTGYEHESAASPSTTQSVGCNHGLCDLGGARAATPWKAFLLETSDAEGHVGPAAGEHRSPRRNFAVGLSAQI
jgi:hypothetical protein